MAARSTAAIGPSSFYVRQSLPAVASFRATPMSCFLQIKRWINGLRRWRITPKVKAKKQRCSSFDDLLENSDKPLLVDFYATWCGPCQYMVPILVEVGEKLKDKVRIVKIDTELYTMIVNRYQIKALPTFILFRDGKPCDRFEGALPAEQLINRIENVLNVRR